MSLRSKTLVIIGATLASLIVALYAFSQMIFLNSFIQLEEESVGRNVERALNALNDELAVIHATDRDWAHWTDTYNFVEDLNDNYREGNTHDGIFLSYGLNVMLFVNTSGEIAFGKAFDLVANQEMSIPSSLMPYLGLEAILLNHTDQNGALNKDGISGILLLPEGPMLIASTPILSTEKEGPARGSLIWGRYLDTQEMDSLADKTRLSLTVHPFDERQLPDDFESARQHLSDTAPRLINPLGAQSIAGYALLKDIYGNPALIFRVDMPRDIYAQGQVSISYFMLSLLLVGVIFAGATLLLLERVVLSRLAYLNASVGNIRISTDLSTRILMSGKDEVSNLATAINEMLEALAQAHEKLEQARDQALEALNLKAQILANVSHDARTPLNVITLRVEMLQRGLYGNLTEQQNELLGTILVSARQLLFFINNLLDQAQLEAGKVTLDRVAFAPAELLTEIEISMLPLATRKGLKLTTEVDANLPQKLWGDPHRLNQIVSNLVVNAIKFTDQGMVKVRLCRPDDTHWALQVSDTGPGIPAEAQGRIFEAFWQVDGSSTRKVARGVGLGLSIVKQLTALMDGQVTVQSENGSGSTFTVTLPMESVQGENVNGHAIRLNR